MASDIVRTLAQVLHLAIQIYIWIIIIRSVLSWMGEIPPHPLARLLSRLTDPVFRLVFRILPYRYAIIGNIDISPLIIIVVLVLADNLLTGLLARYAFQLAVKGG